jgi:hypothetical protein
MLKSSSSDSETVIYVFGCLNEGCGGGKGSWRVFRWTEQPEKGREDRGETSEEPVATTGAAFSSSWGLDEPEDEAFDLADLSEQLKNLASSTTPAPAKKAPTPKTKTKTNKSTDTKATYKEAFDGRIPAFYLVHSADIPPTMDMDSDDEEEARYGPGAAASQGQAEDSEETDEWGGESYEKDTVIRTGKRSDTDEAAFVAYMREVSRVPDQCLRVYGEGAGVPYVWPTKEPRIESSCPRCGAPRRCVLQVMSPLIAAMSESLDMVKDPAGFAAPPSSWDWATLAVSVCAKRCVESETRPYGLTEEAVCALGEA